MEIFFERQAMRFAEGSECAWLATALDIPSTRL